MKELKKLVRNYSQLENRIGELVDPIIREMGKDILKIFSKLIEELKEKNKFDDIMTLGCVIGDYVGGEISNFFMDQVIQIEFQDERFDDVLEKMDSSNSVVH